MGSAVTLWLSVTGRGAAASGPTYAALDLGTNNCRLLVARPTGDSFRVVDAFSRIIRLGEGVSASGRISEAAIDRAVEALAICRDKMRHRGVTRARLIATEACRAAANAAPSSAPASPSEVGLELEIIDRETEATLAATGCTPLIDPQGRRRAPVRHRRRLLRAGAARPLAAEPSAGRPAADQGLGVAAGRRGHARRALRRARGDAEIYAAMVAEVAAFVRRSPPSTDGLATPTCTCSAPRAR